MKTVMDVFKLFRVKNEIFGSTRFLKLRLCVKRINKHLINYKCFPKYKLSHVTIYTCTNTGDTVLSSCIRKLFSDKFGRVSWNLENILDPVDIKYIDRLNKSDAVIIGGHGAFLPDTNSNQESGWEFACSEEKYKLINKPVIVFAIGYNYFNGQERGELFESNVNALVRKSSFFGLRNTGSVREIRSFVDEDIKDRVVYQPCPTMIARYLYPDLPKKKVTGKIAFNVALDRSDMRMGKNASLILDQIAKAMYLIQKRGYEIHFVTHMNTEIDFLKFLKKYPVNFKFHSAALWDVKRTVRFYNEMDAVIGMRGHGIFIPFGVNCHIISLGNQNKTKWFLEDINAMDWLIDINVNPESLCQKIIDKFIDVHEVNSELTTRRLLLEQKRLYEITVNNMERISKIIGGGTPPIEKLQ